MNKYTYKIQYDITMTIHNFRRCIFEEIKKAMERGELRIGNLVKVTKTGGYNNIFQVIKIYSIDSEGVNKWQDMGASGCNTFDGIEGVVLTEDYLLEVGFNKISFSDNYILDGFVLFNEYNGSFSVPMGDYRNDTCAILSFVHQLQNIYFDLTGEELITKTT